MFMAPIHAFNSVVDWNFGSESACSLTDLNIGDNWNPNGPSNSTIVEPRRE